MLAFFKMMKLILVSVLLTGCAIGAADPNEVSKTERAKKFTEVGVEYFKSGDNVSALSWLQKAIEYDSNYGRAYSVLGTVFQTDKENELAEKYYKKSVQIEPESAMFHNNYGAFLFQQKRYSEACRELEQATTDPFYNLRADALNNLGRCYEALNEEGKAGDAFQKSVNLGTRSPAALLNLSKSLLASGDVFQSNKKYSEFLDLVAVNQAQHSAGSLIIGIELARASGNTSDVVTYLLLLENMFPENYAKYKESAE
ncbi:type IV pilus biogenesis/stability protein PilW [Gammaproteobacteria bacterium AS21]